MTVVVCPTPLPTSSGTVASLNEFTRETEICTKSEFGDEYYTPFNSAAKVWSHSYIFTGLKFTSDASEV